MSTALDLDIEALVGELPAVPCEHPEHDTDPIHPDEPASHYMRGHCPVCKRTGAVVAICSGFLAWIAADKPLRCVACSDIRPASEVVIILGPVGGHP